MSKNLTKEEKLDKLDRLFEMQAGLDGYITKERGLNYSKAEWIQKRCLAMLAEAAELMDEVGYKWWKNPREQNDTAIKEELVDILHFFLGMCIDAGMTAQEMFDIYMDKNKENFARQNGTSQKKGYELDSVK